MTADATLNTRLRELFTRAGARAWLHVRELDGEGEVSLDADTPVATASVIKIVFALALAREAAAGRIDATEAVDVPAQFRLGGPGTSGMRDPVRISLRDLALLMLSVSDNAATDVIFRRVGDEAIASAVAAAGLRSTHVRSDMSSAAHRVADALHFPDAFDLDARLARADPDAIRALGWLDPARANASTARDITALLAAIWTDRAGQPAACAFVREAMAEQVTTHRLASGFDDDEVAVAAKSGTLPFIRNEAGVITYADGRRYAAAVFTRADEIAARQPEIDAAIGSAARLAIDHLRDE